ncbi:DivIVA domain-containing protein [Clostridium fungisolvens]|uniref:Cell division initiation protein n=1 Tax=Clostridium fungisolvens TaxID=1604897 RepID=A0A6V8SSG9_9CLOT|nr:DivIVA domain-containing protein [Clostridium fungisolvens]GFP78198.1 hypothetical protein bsdtw1_04393 [Clostridium fungisolvens]
MGDKRVNQLRKFTKVIKGYDTNQVDGYIEKLVEEKDRLIEEISELKIKINEYKDEEDLIKSVLINAEQAALETKSSAERKAAEIVERAKLEAEEIIHSTLMESNKYKQDIYEIFNGHEYKLKRIIEGFYSKAKHNMEEVQNEISKEIENMIARYDEDYKKYNLPDANYKTGDITELEVIVESSIDNLGSIGKRCGLRTDGYYVE